MARAGKGLSSFHGSAACSGLLSRSVSASGRSSHPIRSTRPESRNGGPHSTMQVPNSQSLNIVGKTTMTVEVCTYLGNGESGIQQHLRVALFWCHNLHDFLRLDEFSAGLKLIRRSSGNSASGMSVVVFNSHGMERARQKNIYMCNTIG
ncbi:hypothetical protein KP509_15G061800 [Ceratopteris richardii]|uniref:Uncharacterized protein n=1 Tax=Ceratopteris richardii TaxID=49495 RepID=A0A8T2T418_CERRI|nr:hypothetical protein KP509_15G061800 [Ceratopteris richardii]